MRVTAEITSARILYAKGVLFLVAGLLSGGLLLAEKPTLRVASLLTLCIWCFARSYYFAFYVIERYVDGSYRYSGLVSFARYVWNGRWRRMRRDAPGLRPPSSSFSADVPNRPTAP